MCWTCWSRGRRRWAARCAPERGDWPVVDLLALSAYAFAMCITPGPNVLMVTASGAAHGYRASLPHLLGASAGTGLQTLLVCLGLGEVFVRWPLLHRAMLWAGCAYLLWLGWRLVGAAALQDRPAGPPLGWRQAVALQALNPKAWMMALTTTSLFLPPGAQGLAPALLLGGVMAAVNYPCLSLWTLFGSALRRWLQTPPWRRVFNTGMAAALLFTAWQMLGG